MACEHEVTAPRSVNADGITNCCGAYTSIFIDDQTEYCKCCYETIVEWTNETQQTGVTS